LRFTAGNVFLAGHCVAPVVFQPVVFQVMHLNQLLRHPIFLGWPFAPTLIAENEALPD
jgi:hypothetical protein